ncbi:hypothetical protein [Mycobacterium sp. 1245111.1]|nr:hypothetical protein [Mycobacterium sp. 1245111.1]
MSAFLDCARLSLLAGIALGLSHSVVTLPAPSGQCLASRVAWGGEAP